ncbi:FAD-dependent oxidoreductase, partial [Cellulomonas cellasea]
MTTRVDHVVVGGGVMGAAAAWQLARRGREVVLVERFEPGHARGASHGTSRIYRTTYAAAEYLDLAREALGLWRELEDEAGVPGEVLTLTGGVSQGGPELRAVADAFTARGVPHAWVPAAEAAERWPGLRFEGDVLHEPATAGRLHADRAV